MTARRINGAARRATRDTSVPIASMSSVLARHTVVQGNLDTMLLVADGESPIAGLMPFSAARPIASASMFRQQADPARLSQADLQCRLVGAARRLPGMGVVNCRSPPQLFP
jgi:hypothetical protein